MHEGPAHAGPFALVPDLWRERIESRHARRAIPIIRLDRQRASRAEADGRRWLARRRMPAGRHH